MKTFRSFVIALTMVCCLAPGLAAQNDIASVDFVRASGGVGFKGGTFGVPNFLLDQFLYEYPEIRGQSIAFEIRSYGDRGTHSTITRVYGFEYSSLSGEGPWREKEHHHPKMGMGEATQFSFTVTWLINMFPSWTVHPYIGGGIGIGRVTFWAEGSYTDPGSGYEIKETYNENLFVPVLHIPVGISATLGDRAELRVEGGFKNGFYFGGALAYLF